MTKADPFAQSVQHRAALEPCIACPWRIENRGKRHPDGWYTIRNLRRLWSGLRRGEDMSCHPTDPRNPVSDRARAAGVRQAPAGALLRECAGSVILKQREFMTYQRIVEADPEAGGAGVHGLRYRVLRPIGLTQQGLVAVLNRALLTFPGEIPMRRDHPLDFPVAGPGTLHWPIDNDEIARVIREVPGATE